MGIITDVFVNLIDARTSRKVRLIPEGAKLDRQFMASGDATISVKIVPGTAMDGHVGSIRLTVGDVSGIGNELPYSLFGGTIGNFTGGLVLPVGPHGLRVEVFTRSDAKGSLLSDFVVGFEVGG